MVQLFGVEHAIETQGLEVAFGEAVIATRLKAAHVDSQLLWTLSDLPTGSKVGIETLTDKEWDEVDQYRWDACKAAGFEDPGITAAAKDYWRKIIEHCEETGLEPVLLEDKEVYFRHQDAVIEQAKRKIESEKGPIKQMVPKINLDRQMLMLNEAEYRAEIAALKIFMLDRDIQLLQAIKGNEVVAAIVGRGHSDYWMAHESRINRDLGIVFDSYSTERQVEHERRGLVPIFTSNAEVDYDAANEIERIERAMYLIEHGRVIPSDIQPNFVGTWSLDTPSEGYFEMFITSTATDGEISGSIEDMSGSAFFRGEVTPTKITFTKEYYSGVPERARGKIVFECEKVAYSSGFSGTYKAPRTGGRFTLMCASKVKPIKLAEIWYFMQHQACL